MMIIGTFVASFVLGCLNAYAPEVYGKLVAHTGFENGLAGMIGAALAYLVPERV